MPWAVFVELILRYGLPFAETLLENAGKTDPVTPAEWAALMAKIEIRGEDLIPKRPGV